MNMRKLDLPLENGRATNLKNRKINNLTVSGAQSKITACLLTWAGVSAAPHRFGGVEYRLGRREIGHRSEDVQKAIDLLQLSHELAVKQRHLRNKGK